MYNVTIIFVIGPMSDQNYFSNAQSKLLFLGHLPNLVGHCPMSDSNLQPCMGTELASLSEIPPRLTQDLGYPGWGIFHTKAMTRAGSATPNV
jgi:hypothetical protein